MAEGWTYGAVSMPLVGQASFLPMRNAIEDRILVGVNALSRASLISTFIALLILALAIVCQCP